MPKAREPREHFYQARLTTAEAELVEAAIAASGKTRSDWIRDQMLERARESLDTAAVRPVVVGL